MLDPTITMDEFRKIAPAIKRASQKSKSYTAQDVWGNLMDFSPVDTGRLAGSWRLEERGENFIVGTDVEYALAQNYGVDPFMIYPRRAQALRFEINGQVIFSKEVSHPGFEGSHFVEGSISATENRIPEFVEMALAEEGLT